MLSLSTVVLIIQGCMWFLALHLLGQKTPSFTFSDNKGYISQTRVDSQGPVFHRKFCKISRAISRNSTMSSGKIVPIPSSHFWYQTTVGFDSSWVLTLLVQMSASVTRWSCLVLHLTQLCPLTNIFPTLSDAWVLSHQAVAYRWDNQGCWCLWVDVIKPALMSVCLSVCTYVRTYGCSSTILWFEWNLVCR